jgi:site-specific recombinase XerD
MKVQRIELTENRYSWLVLGSDYLPVKQIQEFIRYLENVERSPNTIRSYAHHLKLYWEYLHSLGKDWNVVKLDDFADFISWLRQHHHNIIPLNPQEARRTESTINAILSSLSSFYSFHQQLSNTNIELIRTSTVPVCVFRPY